MSSLGFFRWTKESTDRLVSLWCQEGASASVIARVISDEFNYPVTRNSVIGKAHRLGLEHPSTGLRIRKSRGSNIPVVKKSLTTQSSDNSKELSPRPSRTPEKRLSPVVAPEPDVDDAPPSLADRIQLVDLRETSCRFPIGDPRSEHFRFCGAPSPIDKPYCNHHARIAYAPRAPAKPRKNGNHQGMRVVQLAAY